MLSDVIYPVGSIYISASSTNPSVYFGGKWESFGTGRCLVGVDTAQTEFNSVLKTGGAKTHTHSQGNSGSTTLTIDQIPNHQHGIYSGWGDMGGTGDNYRFQYWAKEGLSWHYNTLGTSYEGGGKGHVHSNPNTNSSSSLMPYITVYMWRRTS